MNSKTVAVLVAVVVGLGVGVSRMLPEGNEQALEVALQGDWPGLDPVALSGLAAGHLNRRLAREGSGIRAELTLLACADGLPAGVPAISLCPGEAVAGDVSLALHLPGQSSAIDLAPRQLQEARFLTNYVRNILGEQLISVVSSPGREAIGEAVAATALRFGTKLRNQFVVSDRATATELAADLKDRRDAGVLILNLPPDLLAETAMALARGGVRNKVAMPASAALNDFRDRVVGGAGREAAEKFLNEAVFVTPLLFDTAGSAAQRFRGEYTRAFNQRPDWLIAAAFDGLDLLAGSVRAGESVPEIELPGSYSGLMGRDLPVGDGRVQRDLRVGVFEGSDHIAAPIQLTPIAGYRDVNFIEEVKAGRVLYVNDRFMYRTNVVYTGFEPKAVHAVDPDTETAELEFNLWFRYRGDFDTSRIVFHNGMDNITLGEPIRAESVEGINYRLFTVRGVFRSNFLGQTRPYGSNFIGLSFSHSVKNQDNLLFVIDETGMGLDRSTRVLDAFDRKSMFLPVPEWKPVLGLISQDVESHSSGGNPYFVGFGSTSPRFSTVNFAVLVKPNEFDPRDFIPAGWFRWILGLGILLAIVAVVLDRTRGAKSGTGGQTWLLRLLAWPAIVLAGGSLALNYSIAHLQPYTTDALVLIVSCLWWIVPAMLLAMAVERFIWQPLERSTGRMVPNVIRLFLRFVIYGFAAVGIMAFVLDQQLTSILASTGLLAMIIGLAIQANISNVFSGIVLNIERPFKVGDWVKVGAADEGEVVDVTWRTTRVKTRDDYLLSFPNGQVSESTIMNFDQMPKVRLGISVFLGPDLDIDHIAKLLTETTQGCKRVLDEPAAKARFRGLELRYTWMTEFIVHFYVDNYREWLSIRLEVMTAIYKRLQAEDLLPTRGGGGGTSMERDDVFGRPLGDDGVQAVD